MISGHMRASCGEKGWVDIDAGRVTLYIDGNENEWLSM